MKQSLLRYLPLLLLAIAWEVVARLELVSTGALPPLSDVISAGDCDGQGRRTHQ